MTLLIDTYNVLHVVGVLPPEIAGLDTSSLASLLIESRWRGEKCVLVCDGKPTGKPAPESKFIRICFAGPGVSADEVIAGFVKASSAPRRITVVSNDREVQRDARRRRCRIMSAETFLSLLSEDAEKSTNATPVSEQSLGSVEDWVEEFNVADQLDLESTFPPKKDPPKLTPNSESKNTKESKSDLDSIDDLNMNDLIDEDGNWRGPDT